ncbi:Lysosomal beta glucosidase [Phytophthora fragariae]|uniref:beta-glucosidase n=3 Tax=Phytophthora fragariae TaxID=53985 RepID=A0A6A3ZEW7_9STRA|nr:Lysosomal beta glucosidase [Phytophthora fragariae]KAE8948788.1 Lysosomal beta glucosidase [Phytophthora fragariae]KAE9128997.1 Lysosomal beta glucosidase [Phytophthora fragariae]KAE9151266.1 Lysosomal beta glucosidase [Phytophthora fragariae]KAE9235060.1 Lysosomal beta glucosidase [Phytophthora fragariae]
MIVVLAWTLLGWACGGASEVYPTDVAAPARHELVYDPDTAVFADLKVPVEPSDASDGVDIDALLANMTIRQKASQMTQMDIYSMMDGDERDPKKALRREVVARYARAGVGSILNSPFAGGPVGGRTGWSASEWRTVIQQIHQIYKEEGAAVPMLYGVDTIHGATYVQGATLFGQPISAAASFNPELVYRMGAVAAKDTLSAGIPWIFSPVLGIAVQPKWSRVYETFGEDPLVSSVMGAALIKGLQSSGKVVACMKHFIGYSNVREGLDRADNVITDWDLVNYYAPSFLAAVRAGVRTAMESYVSVNGVPVIASKKLLVDLLRHDMNFSGLLVSDYSEVDRMYSEHHLVPSVADAVRVTLQETSLDMNMSPDLQDFGDTIESLVANGLITESRLDESVRRILETKRDLGLLDSGYYDEFGHDGMDADEDVGSLADQEDALKMAQESVILLENRNGTLPIDLKKTTSVFVTGPVSDNKGFQCGGWSVFWQGSIDSTLFPNGATFKEAVQSKAAGHAQVDHLEVVDIDGKVNPQDFQRGIQLAAKSDYTLVVLGERNYAEKTGDLLGSMALPAGQLWYLEELSRLNSTKVIIVLVSGRPRLLEGAHDHADAVILSMLPCEQGGQALADVIFGDVNPSARLPITYPSRGTQLLPYFHRVNTRCQPYDECPVQWEFGHGLSYSKFEYSALWLNTTQVHATSGALEVGVTVTNRGTRPGKEVVLLFVAQKFRRASVPETKLLKAFKKLETLAPGASQDVTFVLTPEHWSYYEPHIIGSGFQRRAEPGEFVVSLLPSSTDSSTPPAPRALDDAERSSQTKTRGAPGGMASEVASAAMAAPSVSFYVVP